MRAVLHYSYLSACSIFCTLSLSSALTTILKVLNHCLCEQGAIWLSILKTNDIRVLSGRVSLIRCAWPVLLFIYKKTVDPPRKLDVPSMLSTVSSLIHAYVEANYGSFIFKYHVKARSIQWDISSPTTNSFTKWKIGALATYILSMLCGQTFYNLKPDYKKIQGDAELYFH
jgi:hypothetical protein